MLSIHTKAGDFYTWTFLSMTRLLCICVLGRGREFKTHELQSDVDI